MPERWWRKHKMRIYHPSIREWEMRDLDVDRFVADCVATHAESIVVRAGGIYACYPSEVPFHPTSGALGEDNDGGPRDLFGEIVARAHKEGLKVIAGVDYGRAREQVWLSHPEWFQRDAVGAPIRDGEYYATCPAGAYQAEAFALPVLTEILTRYRVEGFCIEAAGYCGYCYCPNCREGFGNDIPIDQAMVPELWQAFRRWRVRTVAEQIRRCRQDLRDLVPEIYFVGEVAGPERAGWAEQAAHDVLALSRSFSQLLLSAGDISSRGFRWGASVAAQLAHAARRKRYHVIDLQMQLRREGWPHASMPSAEFTFYAAQALANNAGLKVSTLGTPSRQRDPRSLPTLAQVFDYAAAHEDIIDTMEPIRDVALIWPDALTDGACDAERIARAMRSFRGLYEALVSRHVLFGVLQAAETAPKALRRYGTVVLPSGCGLDEAQREAVLDYAAKGGRLVVIDGEPAVPCPLMPALGIALRDDEVPSPARYACAVGDAACMLQAPLPLFDTYRAVSLPVAATALVMAARTGESGIPGEPSDMAVVPEPIVFSQPYGDGTVVYCGLPLGCAYAQVAYPDYAALVGLMVAPPDETPPMLITDAPVDVQVTMSHWHDGVVIALVNGTGSAPLTSAVLVGSIVLDLAWDGPGLATWYPLGGEARELECREAWNRIQLTVPHLEAFGLVVVRSA